MADDKLYRIIIKEGAHINEKQKADGSKAAIQFDDKNGLKGPVDLVEVVTENENEVTVTEEKTDVNDASVDEIEEEVEVSKIELLQQFVAGGKYRGHKCNYRSTQYGAGLGLMLFLVLCFVIFI